MNCKQVQNKLIFVIEGDLQADESNAVHAHLDNCKECQQLYNQLKVSISFLNEDKLTETNPFFVSRVMAAIELQPQMNPLINWLKNKQYALQVSFYTILVILGILLGHFLGKDRIIEPATAKQDKEVIDDQLFAESYQIQVNEEDVYIIKADDTQE
jgi:predicted anti-sigma-YlaC factor YlaD